jgi:hypothetical protein
VNGAPLSNFPGYYGTVSISGNDDPNPGQGSVVWYFKPAGLLTPAGESLDVFAPYGENQNYPLLAQYNFDYEADPSLPGSMWNGSVLACRRRTVPVGAQGAGLTAYEVVLSKPVPVGTTIILSYFSVEGAPVPPYQQKGGLATNSPAFVVFP